MSRIIATLIASLVLITPHAALALTGSMRCGSDVLTEGMSKVEVLQKCGEPLMKDVVGEETAYDVVQGSGTATKVTVEQFV